MEADVIEGVETTEHQVLKDELLGATVVPWEKVQIPELGKGKFVYVQGLSGTERDEFEASLVNQKGRRRGNIRARLVARSVVSQPGGARVYTDDDVLRVGKIRVDVLQRIWVAAQKLSGFSDQDVEELEQTSAS